MTRDERQEISINKWKTAKGLGLMLLPTGFGKTIVAIKIIKKIKAKKGEVNVLIVVPSDYLKQQWESILKKHNCDDVSTVLIINTAIKARRNCDLLIADEVHMFCGKRFFNLFQLVTYKWFLGLTATLQRLDGLERKLLNIFPIIDSITLDEAVKNEWISPFKQYKVELNVDLEEYIEYNRQFIHHFSFFDYNFDLAMGCLQYPIRYKMHQVTGQPMKTIILHAMGFSKAMSNRMKFINNHPVKIELANKIIESRLKDKIITFTKNVEHSKLIAYGDVYHAKLSKKTKDRIVDEFNKKEFGVLNTCKALDVGADIEGVTLAILLSGDSSKISKKQKLGRAIRFKEDKVAEIFTFVIKGTVEEQWFTKSNANLDYEIIQDYQLDDLLNGKEVQESDEDLTFLFTL